MIIHFVPFTRLRSPRPSSPLPAPLNHLLVFNTISASLVPRFSHKPSEIIRKINKNIEFKEKNISQYKPFSQSIDANKLIVLNIIF